METDSQLKSAVMGGVYGMAAIIFIVGLINAGGFILRSAGKVMGCA